MKFSRKKKLNKAEQIELVVDLRNGLKEKERCLNTVFHLVQIVAADHPELEDEVKVAELLIQFDRNEIHDTLARLPDMI